uniref:Uncharacterized protein n=1 Tax=Acrobeloides nanus TaxID=290746 RepID=A0A914C8Y8_9BILA
MMQILFTKELKRAKQKSSINEEDIFNIVKNQFNNLMNRNIYEDFIGPNFIPRYKKHDETLKTLQQLKQINFVSKEQVVYHFIKHVDHKISKIEDLTDPQLYQQILEYFQNAQNVIKFNADDNTYVSKFFVHSQWEQVGGSRTFTFYKKENERIAMAAVIVSEYGEVYLKTYFTTDNMTQTKKATINDPKLHKNISLLPTEPYSLFMKWYCENKCSN